MPLIKGKSQKSFVKNLKTEIHEGKPMKQSLAIAYAMKKKANKNKYDDGGIVKKDSEYGKSLADLSKSNEEKAGDKADAAKIFGSHFSKGGQVSPYGKSSPEEML